MHFVATSSIGGWPLACLDPAFRPKPASGLALTGPLRGEV